MLRPKFRLLVLEESQLLAIMRDARFLEVIGCLRLPARKLGELHGGCSSCQSSRDRTRHDVVRMAKTCIIGMSEKERIRFKRLLNAEQVRLIYYNERSKKVELTF